MARGVMDLFLIYQFIRRLVKPFDKWEAYKTGVIDEKGNVVVKKKDRTEEQKKSWGYYDRLVANLKKLLGKIPGGKTRIASFAAALLLLREENIDPDDTEFLQERLNHYLKEAEYLIEEMPTNVVGTGKVAGLGVGPQGEPPAETALLRKKKKKDVLKRKMLDDISETKKHRAKKTGYQVYEYRGYEIEKMQHGWNIKPKGETYATDTESTKKAAMELIDKYEDG